MGWINMTTTADVLHPTPWYAQPAPAKPDAFMAHDVMRPFDRFTEQVSGRALVMMEMATQHHDVARDLVQEALISLAGRYLDRPQEEWIALFYGILNRRLMDWRRQEVRRSKLFAWFRPQHTLDDDELEVDPLHLIVDEQQADPSQLLTAADDLERVQAAIAQLPARQQQAFLLRAWENLDVRTTAQAMQCSEGSVKTHYFRAIEALRANLAGDFPSR
jgi:RNA polymerase sigma-70 factor (ECF subfamily)